MPFETQGPDGPKRRSSALARDNASFGLNAASFTGTLVGQGYAKDEEALAESAGSHLNIMQAFMVSFCIAFGAGIALVGWYPKLAGVWGFAFVIVVVSVSGGVAENALHVTSIRTNAQSFNELCASLPTWMSRFTTVSMVAWGFTIAGLYVRYVFTFFNDQILTTPLPKEGWGAAGLYIPIGVVVYFITLPPKFSGSVVKFITNVNLGTTWVVIVTAIIKGLYMVWDTPAENRPTDYAQWKPQGFLQVTVLLAGAMFQCSAVPRLQYEILPSLRERAAVMIPLLLAVVQGVIFLIIGLIGYWALGDCIGDDGDVFKSYYDVRPDFLVTILQGGIALLMFLSLPLLGVPPKNELWSLLQLSKPAEEKVPFEESSALAQALINLGMVLYAVFTPMLLGSDNLTALVTVLAGSAANWLNLFLPGFVNLYANVIPSRAAGEPWIASACKSGWIFLLATASLASSGFEVAAMIQDFGGPKTAAATTTVLSEFNCTVLQKI